MQRRGKASLRCQSCGDGLSSPPQHQAHSAEPPPGSADTVMSQLVMEQLNGQWWNPGGPRTPEHAWSRASRSLCCLWVTSSSGFGPKYQMGWPDRSQILHWDTCELSRTESFTEGFLLVWAWQDGGANTSTPTHKPSTAEPTAPAWQENAEPSPAQKLPNGGAEPRVPPEGSRYSQQCPRCPGQWSWRELSPRRRWRAAELWGCEGWGSQLLTGSSGHRRPCDASTLHGEGEKRTTTSAKNPNPPTGVVAERKGPCAPKRRC